MTIIKTAHIVSVELTWRGYKTCAIYINESDIKAYNSKRWFFKTKCKPGWYEAEDKQNILKDELAMWRRIVAESELANTNWVVSPDKKLYHPHIVTIITTNPNAEYGFYIHPNMKPSNVKGIVRWLTSTNLETIGLPKTMISEDFPVNTFALETLFSGGSHEAS